MDKEKFYIPMPTDQTIESEINQIVSAGVKRKQTFLSSLKSMYGQVGIRYLFSDRSELVLTLFIAIALLSLLFISPEQGIAEVHSLYSFIFLVSPVLFLVFSVYTYSNKISNTTFEVEMACKYNVFQIIAFRMLMFSVITILINIVVISFMINVYDDIQFLRAFMISVTGLFLFSILFLRVLMIRRSTIAVGIVLCGWTFGNILLSFMDSKLYIEILTIMPLYVHAIVLCLSIYVYMRSINRLFHFVQAEGDLT